MQPFDNGRFDQRYESVFAPAIAAAGVDAYRVDRDPAASILIQDIENGIRNSELCFADISTDNPNVWFELGFALAIPREVILVCSDERETKYPFDVQHRNIISYNTNAPQDFDKLKSNITMRINALLDKIKTLDKSVSSFQIGKIQDLRENESAALVSVMTNSFLSGGYVSGYTIYNDMKAYGFSDIHVSLALKILTSKEMIIMDIRQDGLEEPHPAYRISDLGEQWLVDNQDNLPLKQPVDSLPY